jgi:hypothetical protein
MAGAWIARRSQARNIATRAPATVATKDTAEIGWSSRLIGASGARPPVDEVAAGSGSWIVTDLTTVAGIVIGFLHFGQGPVWPAKRSLTVNRALHPGQTTGIGIAGPWRRRDGRNAARQCQTDAGARQAAGRRVD